MGLSVVVALSFLCLEFCLHTTNRDDLNNRFLFSGELAGSLSLLRHEEVADRNDRS